MQKTSFVARAISLMMLTAAAAAVGSGCGAKKGDTFEDAPLADSGRPAADAASDFDVAFNGPNDSGNTPPPADAGTQTCATTSQKAEVAPIDMFVMLDRSNSMSQEGKWEAVINAIGNAVYDKRFYGMGLGLQYFPQQAICTPAAYSAPAVAIGTLSSGSGPDGGPNQQQQVVASLAANNPWGNSPIVPAMEGAVTYTKAHQFAHPSRTSVILLATDGLPDDSCQFVPDGGIVNDLDGVIQVAQSASAGSPPLRTFVIGVGTALSGLDQIAAAGGTQSAIIVDVTQGLEQQFMDALDAIRKKALPCDYVIPPSSDAGAIDFSKVNVRFSPNDGNASSDLVYVKSPANCGLAASGKGWFYDDDANPAKVLLCPESCTTAKSSEAGQIDILFGCQTTTAPTVEPPPPPK